MKPPSPVLATPPSDAPTKHSNIHALPVGEPAVDLLARLLNLVQHRRVVQPLFGLDVRRLLGQ